ncbi:Rossmann fold domain-containing protein [Novosphingobium sp. RD2P27]|uniref:Rossmann fold domain-containing protein n=1 Tax=Novosphingobium kalidii TaxID=3230299 RepID=A0ABV2D0G4_9SPHN
MVLMRVGASAKEPLAASAQFYSELLPRVREQLARGGDVVLVFELDDQTHHAWQRAAVQELARAHAPARVNALAGGSEDAIKAAADYLSCAPGVTGQLLPLDGTGAGAMLYPSG